MRKNRNIWLDGVMGVIVGDALGCPVQFRSRDEIGADPVTGMRGHGTYDMPVGTWTDDGSMSLASMDSIRENAGINPENIMYRFVCWLTMGEYTPFGESFDIGNGTLMAIKKYIRHPNISTCGAFRNPPELAAGVFREVTEEFRHCFQTVEYAVFHTETEIRNYEAFAQAFM